MISYIPNSFIFYWVNYYFINYFSMMTRYHSRKNISRTPYSKCIIWFTMRNNSIYYLRNFLFHFFFWAFFHNSLSPTIELGLLWPPKIITPFNPIQIPPLNTLVLLRSGISVTWAHHSLIENNYKQSFQALLITVILDLYFTIFQSYEYIEASFSISDSIYGTTFFIATGFHGNHVIIGTTFLLICLTRHYINHFSSSHHFGFEAAAWYWHFVDVVWLFLYVSIYWWGSYLHNMNIIINFQLINMNYRVSNFNYLNLMFF